MKTIFWIIGYIIIINIIGFIIMGIDKSRARKQEWRIRETTFFLIAIIGGSIGCILGMYSFRHKTKHWYFVWGMPIILIIQILIAGYISISPSISIIIL